ncbi:TetR/AcrR family transcriptional regulator [Rhodoflexus sp.]
MGVSERKEREKQEMRDLILRTATHMFVEEGYDKTSIRNIAERIEYSPATIYLYFKDKKELFYAIHERAFEQFFAHLSAAEAVSHPIQRLRRMGELYIDFAFQNPELYDLMFIMRAPMEAVKENRTAWDYGPRSFELLRKTIIDCMNEGLMKVMNLDVAALSILSFIHGFTSMMIRDRFLIYQPETLRPLLEQSLDNMIDLMKT